MGAELGLGAPGVGAGLGADGWSADAGFSVAAFWSLIVVSSLPRVTAAHCCQPGRCAECCQSLKQVIPCSEN